MMSADIIHKCDWSILILDHNFIPLLHVLAGDKALVLCSKTQFYIDIGRTGKSIGMQSGYITKHVRSTLKPKHTCNTYLPKLDSFSSYSMNLDQSTL